MSAADEDTFHKAVKRCDLEAIRHFVEVEGADVDCRDEDGISPLINAALILGGKNARAASAVISYLVSKNANVEVSAGPHSNFYTDTTALMIASHNGNLPVVKILLEQGHANVNHSIPESGDTALMFSTKDERGLCVVSTLLQHGAIVNPVLTTYWDYIPLLKICRFKGAVKVVQQMLEYGANVDAEDRYGLTALHIAAQCSDKATVRLLIAHGGNVNVHSQLESTSKTPLSTAAYHGNVAILRVLLEHAAQVDIMFGHGESILHVAARKDNAEILRILLEHCRGTMAKAKFVSFLLQADEIWAIALQYAPSVKIAKLCIEQPRGRDQKLSSACHAQLMWYRASYRRTDLTGEYIGTFESLELTVPGDESTETQRTMANGEIAVKLNPKLSDFQLSVAQEALELVVDVTDCPGYMAHAVLGYLSPVDVMKRREVWGIV